jgi:nicotinate-nucleotide adenylyltransferase
MKKIGVLGGTFDPIHIGHLAIADEARQCLNLDTIFFMPAGHPYFKEGMKVTSVVHRVRMVRLALAGQPHFRLSLIEIKRPGPSYAVETLERLKTRLTARDELLFILGWDSLLGLPRWYAVDRLVRLCRIVAAPRPGYPPPDLDLLEKQLPGISTRIIILDKPIIDISSTQVRDRVRQGLPVDMLVPPAVGDYIREKKLYL